MEAEQIPGLQKTTLHKITPRIHPPSTYLITHGCHGDATGGLAAGMPRREERALALALLLTLLVAKPGTADS